MNKTFYEKMLENLLVDLEHYLPILAGRIVAFLVIFFKLILRNI